MIFSEQFNRRAGGAGNIIPLFWQHGEDEAVLRNEIRQMNEKGISELIIESRPHPDFLGDQWWHDIDVILDEADQRSMKVWLFDDSRFPSGYAAGKVYANHPEFRKMFLSERHIDAIGPFPGSSFKIEGWVGCEENLVCVIAAKRTDGNNKIEGETLTDITEHITDGILYWDVPEGSWRVFIIVSTYSGGEDGLEKYINQLEPEPVKAYINYVHEEFYGRYSRYFGNLISGFFSDEPRLGNITTYEATLSRFNDVSMGMVIPWSENMLSHLEKAWKGRFDLFLPCLWYDAGEVSAFAQYCYMDTISKRFEECYMRQIGDWCRERGVKFIGHVIEDNGAHARLGYGLGHFFRALSGQDYSGMDIVFQVWPEYTSGRYTTPFGYLDADFFYWGIAKLASSAGHIDPLKSGITACEIFGAYGWQEGLKLMKWLTDHVCVRGVNKLIPHAFSPRKGDEDCPPHFYAAGENPQWRYFRTWSEYADRLCSLLSGGRHVAPAAVLYHAEAEWAGKYMPFEKVVKVLLKAQIDCDIVPIDTLADIDAAKVSDGMLDINHEKYGVLVIPYAERLPERLMQRLLELSQKGTKIIFIDGFPTGSCDRQEAFPDALKLLKEQPEVMLCEVNGLPGKLYELELNDIKAGSAENDLRYYHYENDYGHLYFFVNESKYNKVDTNITFKENCLPFAYDALTDKAFDIRAEKLSDRVSIDLILQPYESLFVILPHDGNPRPDLQYSPLHEAHRQNASDKHNICGNWGISMTKADKYPVFGNSLGFSDLGNVSVPGKLPRFSGTIRYENFFTLTSGHAEYKSAILDIGSAFETAEVWINGSNAGVRICPPYTFDVSTLLAAGKNAIAIEVTNTLSKAKKSNNFDRAMPQEPSGLLGPVTIDFYEN